MKKPRKRRVCLTVGMVVLLVLFMGPGCWESKPMSPKAADFRKEVQAVLKRLAPPLAEPVAREDSAAVQKVLMRLFALCAGDCENLIDNIVVLDKDGISIAVYPFQKCRMWQYAEYAAIQKAMMSRRPTQAVLYVQGGGSIYVVCAPLLYPQNHVTGVLCLGFEGEKVQEKRGISREEFLSLEIQNPD